MDKDQSVYGLAAVVLEQQWFQRPKPEIVDVFAAILSSAQPFVEYVRNGRIEHDRAILRRLPIARIGQIETVSSREIESLRAIRRLTDSYLADRDTRRTPLGLAVFGQPGTGKSFTVKSVFNTLTGISKKMIEGSFIECNLSGLSGPEDITNVFQRARDLRLEGKVPVIFFDEFDCTVDGAEFFWLKHFLAPLQDGVFRSRDATHPIGKSIFVFAGSFSHSFTRFSEHLKEPDTQKRRDFLSRLRGHIDVEGLWPADEGGKPRADPGDDFFACSAFRKYVIRRTIILRQLLKRWAPTIFKASGEAEAARIDENIVKAFLRESEYRYGVRSIEAVIQMSSVGPDSHFTAECLPTREQLQMHVSEKFYGRAFGLEP